MLQESEPNDNLATANQLPLNTWMRGIMEEDNYETDWYQIYDSAEQSDIY